MLCLAKLWDANNLLRLRPPSSGERGSCKVFNAYKSESRDRQIGDRRLPNQHEMRMEGPSRLLPSGVLFANLRLRRWRTLSALLRLQGSCGLAATSVEAVASSITQPGLPFEPLGRKLLMTMTVPPSPAQPVYPCPSGLLFLRKGVLGPVGADVGLQVSPPIGPQSSHHFQLLEPDLASWLFSVLQAKHVRSLLLEKQVARAILLFRFACREGLPALLMVPMRSAWVGGDAWNRAACGHGATWTLSLCH